MARARASILLLVVRKSWRFEKNNIATTIRHAVVYRSVPWGSREFRKNPGTRGQWRIAGQIKGRKTSWNNLASGPMKTKLCCVEAQEGTLTSFLLFANDSPFSFSNFFLSPTKLLCFFLFFFFLFSIPWFQRLV